jgi:hypothetical protein
MAFWLSVGTILIALSVAAVLGYLGKVTGALTLDTGWGRRVRPLGPLTVRVAAPRDDVFELLAQPYLGRATRAMQDKVQVLERGSDMVLASHKTRVGRRLIAATVETVRFHPPERMDFRLLRGPVPHVVESFQLTVEANGVTRLDYSGELGTDGWLPGAWWGNLVARRWNAAVEATFAAVKAEAERRTRGPQPGP